MIYKSNPKNVRWFLMYSFGKATNKLLHLLEVSNLTDKLVEIFAPKERVRSIDKNEVKEFDFYPGCMLVAFDIQDPIEIHDIASLLIKDKNTLAEVKAEEVARIKELAEDFIAKPTTELNMKANDSIRIISGPYKNMHGKIVDIDINSKKVEIDLNIFDRDVRVSLTLDDIQKDSV